MSCIFPNWREGEQLKSYLSKMKVQWEAEKFAEVLASSLNFSVCFSGTQMLTHMGKLPLSKTHMLLFKIKLKYIFHGKNCLIDSLLAFFHILKFTLFQISSLAADGQGSKRAWFGQQVTSQSLLLEECEIQLWNELLLTTMYVHFTYFIGFLWVFWISHTVSWYIWDIDADTNWM